MLAALYFLRLLTLEPEPATRAAAAMVGAPELADELVQICRREGPGHSCDRLVGVHTNNTPRAIKLFYNKARTRGWVNPEACATHRVEAREMSVRGVHGLAAAYSLRYLQPCAAPAALDNAFLSGVAAARRMLDMCNRRGACVRESRHVLWYGAAGFKRRAARNDSSA